MRATDRAVALSSLSDEDVVEALAAASRANDPLVSNILATEATNRMGRLRASLANLGEGVLTLGPDGRVRWANPEAERLLGMARAQMMGRPLEELQGAGARTLAEIVARRPARGEAPAFVRADGSSIDVAYTAATILAHDGSDVGTVLTLADCTQRRRHERALRESEQRFRSLFEHFPEAIVSLTVDGTILDANAGAETLMALPASAIRARSFAEFLLPEDLERAAGLFARVAAGEVSKARITIVRGDGSHTAIDAFGIPVVVDGEVVGIHGLAREVGVGTRPSVRSSVGSVQTS